MIKSPARIASAGLNVLLPSVVRRRGHAEGVEGLPRIKPRPSSCRAQTCLPHARRSRTGWSWLVSRLVRPSSVLSISARSGETAHWIPSTDRDQSQVARAKGGRLKPRPIARRHSPDPGSTCDLRPSHLPRCRRTRSRAPLSFATNAAFSNWATAPRIWRTRIAVGVSSTKLSGLSAAMSSIPRLRSILCPVSCTMRSRAKRLALSTIATLTPLPATRARSAATPRHRSDPPTSS